MQFRLLSTFKSAIHRPPLRIVFIITFCCLLGAARFWPGSHPFAHVPITTKMTFNRDVVRILQRNCIGCHRSGGIAFSLATYEEARPWAKDIEYEMLRRKMPPWNAMRGFGDFINAPQLTQRDIDLVVNWTEGGTPKGDDKDLPPAPIYRPGWQLGQPDLMLKPASESNVPAGQDKYETVSLTTGLKNDRWLRALDLNPGNALVVHSATFYLEGLGGGDGDQFLGSWIPGQKPVAFPEGTGWLLPAGSRIKVKIHYHGGETAAADQSEIGIYLTVTPPEKKLSLATVSNPNPSDPAGEATGCARAQYLVGQDSDLVAIRPASSKSILSVQATAYRPDGTQEVLIWTKGPLSDWAPVYYLMRPARLPKGTRIETVTYLDEPDQKATGQPGELRSGLGPDPLCILLLAAKGTEAARR